MKTRIVNQYACEFCNKRGLSAAHISKHERHCTKNPSRICRVCGMLEQSQPEISALIAVIPNVTPDEFGIWDTDKLNAALPELLEKAGNCPACVMAALTI